MAVEVDPVQQQNPRQTEAQHQAPRRAFKMQPGTRHAEGYDRESINHKEDCKDAKHRPQRIEAEGFEKPAMDYMPEAARHAAGQTGNAGEGMERTFVEIGETGRHNPGCSQSHQPDCSPYQLMVHTSFR